MTRVGTAPETDSILTLRRMQATNFGMDGKQYPLVLPAGVYLPDTWTRMLIRGLLLHLAGRPSTCMVVEVGAGSGIVPIVLGRSKLPTSALEYVGLDLNGVACEAARLNVQLNGSALPARFISGGHLLDRLPADRSGRVDVLAANLPQVPDLDLGRGNVNDYYPPRPRSDALTQRLEQCGVGLLLDLLVASRAALSPSGTLVLTVAGRCGGAELARLFGFCDMTYEILDRIIVRHDPSTSLEYFHKTEETSDIRFEFYADEAGQQPISASTAAQAADQGIPVYHDLYAVAARFTTHCPAAGTRFTAAG